MKETKNNTRNCDLSMPLQNAFMMNLGLRQKHFDQSSGVGLFLADSNSRTRESVVLAVTVGVDFTFEEL
jgi:hypothetical protein